MQKLKPAFYKKTDVGLVAKQLLGKLLVTNFNNQLTAGRIVETEAYNGIADKASHAYNNRRTNRTEVMYSEGGTAYVYLCYGIHHLFNVVTGIINMPQAVLIRGIEPVQGIDVMMQRMKKQVADFTIGRGPGNVSKALGIYTTYTGYNLLSNEIYVADDKFIVTKEMIIITTRIGVDYAAEDALLPYRFFIKGNRYVSRGRLSS
jgi:DNA-3-methyladenine glycosylase